jgi:orotate phosphoribosyltransferase
MTFTAPDKPRLVELIKELAIVHGKVTLSSGIEADYYVDLRRATLHHEASPLIGNLPSAEWAMAPDTLAAWEARVYVLA